MSQFSDHESEQYDSDAEELGSLGDMSSDGDGHLYRRSRPSSRQASRVEDRINPCKTPTTPSNDVELDRYSDDQEAGLSRHEKLQRKRRRESKADLDIRIGGSASTESAPRRMWRDIAINALLVLSWYLFSLSISIYNKWMFAPRYLDFHFPLFVTCLHMLVQFFLASAVLFFLPHLRPRPPTLNDGTHQQSLMTRIFYITRIGPCGAATGLDIGLGNMSLKFITLTFYTMCKSSSLAFVLAFAFLFRLEAPSWRLIAIIATMTVGVIMMVAGEVAFDTLGFILVILAAFFSGFRWSLTQILLLRSPATSNPFSSIFFLAPVMFLSLAIIAMPVEGPMQLTQGLAKLFDGKGTIMGIGILIFPGLLAFLMTASEFALLQRTSVVTLSICGIFKEVVTISAAGIVYKDPLTPINISGLLVTIASIAAYNYLKISKLRQQVEAEGSEEPRDESATEPMLRK